eukprot:tig00020538_g10322.t1
MPCAGRARLAISALVLLWAAAASAEILDVETYDCAFCRCAPRTEFAAVSAPVTISADGRCNNEKIYGYKSYLVRACGADVDVDLFTETGCAGAMLRLRGGSDQCNTSPRVVGGISYDFSFRGICRAEYPGTDTQIGLQNRDAADRSLAIGLGVGLSCAALIRVLLDYVLYKVIV